MDDKILDIRKEITLHESNRLLKELGYEPLFAASATARIVIIGQAPGIKAQSNKLVWSDASGARLIKWLGISESTFRNESLIAHIPMDFYYPGKGKTGDNPPRKEFAALWHRRIIELMPQVQLIVLIGKYAQDYYLGAAKAPTLTETVRNYQSYLPTYFPLVHPSPLNFRWFSKNPWFEEDVIPALQGQVKNALDKNNTDV